MKPIKKRRSGIDPLYLIIGGALLLMVILVSLSREPVQSCGTAVPATRCMIAGTVCRIARG